jgi:hypothetical protein
MSIPKGLNRITSYHLHHLRHHLLLLRLGTDMQRFRLTQVPTSSATIKSHSGRPSLFAIRRTVQVHLPETLPRAIRKLRRTSRPNRIRSLMSRSKLERKGRIVLGRRIRGSKSLLLDLSSLDRNRSAGLVRETGNEYEASRWS